MAWTWAEGRGSTWRPKGGQPYVVAARTVPQKGYTATLVARGRDERPRLLLSRDRLCKADDRATREQVQGCCERHWRNHGPKGQLELPGVSCG